MKAQTTSGKQQQRALTIETRYLLKKNGSIIYVLRNAVGKRYATTISHYGRPSCQEAETGEACKGNAYGRQCYHVAYALQREAERHEAEAREAVRGDATLNGNCPFSLMR